MVLVTGGTGLVGSHLLFKLVSNGVAVRAIYRQEKKLQTVKKIFSYYTEEYDSLFQKIDWVQADILDIPKLTIAFKGITEVYHVAAFVSFEPDKYNLLRKTNIEGTANIVNLSLAFKVQKMCYVSSVATLGQAGKDKYINEETSWDNDADNSGYAITKYGAELEVWRGTQEGLNAIIVNPGVILGPGIWRYGSGSLIKQIHSGLPFYTVGSVGYIDVIDVVNCMILLMNSDIINSNFILIAENWSYKKFIYEVAKHLNTKPPTKKAGNLTLQLAWRLDWLQHKIFRKRRKLSKQLAQTLQENKKYDATKLKQTLNYQFIPISESIEKVCRLYRLEN